MNKNENNSKNKVFILCRMKKSIIFFWICCFSSGFSQINSHWNNTFVYAVQLPKKLDSFAGVSVVLKYKGEPLISEKKYIGGKKVKIASEFFYNSQKSNQIGTIKLPFPLQKNTYYWLLDADMVIEMATFPDRFKMDVVTANPKATEYYQLPETFDLTSENTLNIAYLQSLSKTKREALLKEKNWTLSVSSKEKIDAEVIKDTILTYSLRGIIPKGIQKVVPNINKQDHSVQEFIIENCYLVDKTLLIPIKSNQKIKSTKPDACHENYTTIAGDQCAASGCITGMGSGLCVKIKTSKTKIKYRVSIQIEP